MCTGEEQLCYKSMGKFWGCYRTPGQNHNQGLKRQKKGHHVNLWINALHTNENTGCYIKVARSSLGGG